MSTNRTNRTEAWLLVMAVVLFLFYLGINAHTHFSDLSRIPFVLVVPVAAVLGLAHGGYMLGWKRALFLFGVTFGVATTFEMFGQLTGILFGPYCYTDLLHGPRMFGRIPLLIPLAWFSMIYPSYVIANMLGEGQPISRPQRPWQWILWMAFLSAMVMTAWDLVMDPVMSYQTTGNDPNIWDPGEVGVPAWRWLAEHSGAATCGTSAPLPHGPTTHFGVPFQNYMGWLITATTLFAIFRLSEHRFPIPIGGNRRRKTVVLMPILTYGMVGLGDIWLGYPEIADVRLISPFVMGVLFVAASMLVFRPPPADPIGPPAATVDPPDSMGAPVGPPDDAPRPPVEPGARDERGHLRRPD